MTYEEIFWNNHDEPTGNREEIRRYVRMALEFMEDDGHDPLTDKRIENAVQAACETQPSWGHRLYRIWSALGQNFGDPDSIEWSIQRDMFRLFAGNPDAVKAVQENNQDFPPRFTPLR